MAGERQRTNSKSEVAQDVDDQLALGALNAQGERVWRIACDDLDAPLREDRTRIIVALHEVDGRTGHRIAGSEHRSMDV